MKVIISLIPELPEELLFCTYFIGSRKGFYKDDKANKG